jgi:hypothetical protein
VLDLARKSWVPFLVILSSWIWVRAGPLAEGSGRPSAAVIRLSARTGEGISLLEDAVASLFPAGDGADGGVLTNARQQEAALRARRAIGRAAEALEGGITADAVLTDAEEALSALGELTGRTAGEEIVPGFSEVLCRKIARFSVKIVPIFSKRGLQNHIPVLYFLTGKICAYRREPLTESPPGGQRSETYV